MRILLSAVVGAGVLSAADCAAQYAPSWWFDAANPIIVSGAPVQNFAVVNTGQLKWMATRAKAHLDSTVPGGAGSAINSLVVSFKPQAGVTYLPSELAAIRRDNYAPVNLGQVKAVAQLFYARLHDGVSYDTNRGLKANGYSPTWTSNYPWETAPLSPLSQNYVPVTIGQLKLIFSFDIVDSNHNGVLDYTEGIYPAEFATSTDSDGDGVFDAEDAFPHDPSQSVTLVANSADHTAPILTVSKPNGAVLVP